VFPTGYFSPRPLNITLGVRQGYGVHFEALGPDFVTDFFRNLFVGEIFYTLTLCLAKYSILTFCWRLFGSTISIRLPIYILGAIITSWGIAVVSSSSAVFVSVEFTDPAE